MRNRGPAGDLAENYLATLLLRLRQPFEPGDHVVIEGKEGKVLRLTSRATILMTLDGNHMHVPNAMVFKGVIVNYSRNPTRRCDMTFSVPADVPLPRALLERVGELPGVIDEPAPACETVGTTDGKAELRLLAWVDQRHHDLVRVRSRAVRIVRDLLAKPPARAPAHDGAKAGDTAVDRSLEHAFAADRERGDGDLLDRSARRE